MAPTKTSRNDALEHTEGGATTRDGMDAGVPMIAGQPTEPVGPEDALGAGPKRGDYSDRLTSGPMMVTRENPDADTDAGEPRYELVPADGHVSDIGDAPGKGGVSTADAVAAATTVSPAAAMPAPAGSGAKARQGS